MLALEEELEEDLAELGLGDSVKEDGLPPLEDLLADDEARARYYSVTLPASALAMLAEEREEGAQEPAASQSSRQPSAKLSRPQLTAEQEALSRRYPRMRR